MSLLLDPVTNAPVLTTTGRVLARVLVAERMPDPPRIVQQRADDELRGRGSDLLRETGELALGARPDIKPPATARVGHAAPVLRNR